uniref:Small ribosomal subunit protein uS14m n=1 Tax=Haslea nusantara TaxID=2600302 RepID=A0A5B8HVJ8_9STRA|nr:ribosomal protein S14 [Haslea nusantara]QDX17598.1 ribosomal protein S14 [Haslea nusantara]
MKKILVKDKKIRKKIKILEKKRFILKSIQNNSKFCNLVRLNTFYKLSSLPVSSSKSLISNRCVETINKKKFTGLANFSRIVFLKLVKNGSLYGMQKYYW